MAPTKTLGGPEHRGGIKRSSHTALGSISARRRGKSALFEAVQTYISGLTVTQGEGIGGPFQLLPWETRFLRGALAPGVGEAALTVAPRCREIHVGRGDSLTAYLDGDGTAAPASEITLVATTLKQSRKVFAHVVRFLEASGRMGDFRKQDTVNVCGLQNRRDGRALGVPGCASWGASMALLPRWCWRMKPRSGRWLASMPCWRQFGRGLARSRTAGLLFSEREPRHPAIRLPRALETADYCQVHAARPDDPIGHKRTWCRGQPVAEILPRHGARYSPWRRSGRSWTRRSSRASRRSG